MPVGVQNLDVDAEMWVKLRLTPRKPYVGTLSIAFVRLPTIKLMLAPFRIVNLFGKWRGKGCAELKLLRWRVGSSAAVIICTKAHVLNNTLISRNIDELCRNVSPNNSLIVSIMCPRFPSSMHVLASPTGYFSRSLPL